MSGHSGKALKYAYRLLGYRGRSRRELRERLLQKGFDRGIAEDVIERLCEMGFLDDDALAQNLRRKAEEVKLLGRAGASSFLRQRGIPQKIVEEALDGYDEGESAAQLIEKKLRSVRHCSPTIRKRRLVGYLRRRGYSAETTRRALSVYEREVSE